MFRLKSLNTFFNGCFQYYSRWLTDFCVSDTRKWPEHVVEIKRLSKNSLLAVQSDSITLDSRPVKKISAILFFSLVSAFRTSALPPDGCFVILQQ